MRGIYLFVKDRFDVRILLMGILCLMLGAATPASAQMAYTIQVEPAQVAASRTESKPSKGSPEKRPPILIEGKDRPREINEVVLYTPDYTRSTQTSPYGSEVVALQAGANSYRVEKVITLQACKAQQALSACGNVEIPPNGIVLSASGSQEFPLTTLLPIGTQFTLVPVWFHEETHPYTLMDPTAESNPSGKEFPGMRGVGQLVVYTEKFGDKTGTNPFGYEVTVVKDRVVAQEGADSAIPKDGFVLSGHGGNRAWLISHLPVGSLVKLDPKKNMLSASIDLETYRRQWEAKRQQLSCSDKTRALCHELHELENKVEKLAKHKKDHETAAALLATSLTALDEAAWKQFTPLEATAPQGVWHRPVETTPEAIVETLDRFKAMGINTIYLETFFHGYPIFPSQTLTAYGIAKNQTPKFKGFDPLAVWAGEAHKRNIKLHTWFQTFYVGNTVLEGPGPILSQYPQWASIQRAQVSESPEDRITPQPAMAESGAYFLDPANPEVQRFLADLLDEIARRYSVDGIQLDYIRYPASLSPDRENYLATTSGYSWAARHSFIARYGVDPATLTPEQTEAWKQWKQFCADQVSHFVRQVSIDLHEKYPKLQLSAAIFPVWEEAWQKKNQDWPLWGKNHWVDALVPMTLTGSVDLVSQNVRDVIKATDGKVPVIAGLFSPFQNLPAERLLEQIQAADKAKAEGISIFDSAHMTGRMVRALSAVQEGDVKSGASVPRHSKRND